MATLSSLSSLLAGDKVEPDPAESDTSSLTDMSSSALSDMGLGAETAEAEAEVSIPNSTRSSPPGPGPGPGPAEAESIVVRVIEIVPLEEEEEDKKPQLAAAERRRLTRNRSRHTPSAVGKEKDKEVVLAQKTAEPEPQPEPEKTTVNVASKPWTTSLSTESTPSDPAPQKEDPLRSASSTKPIGQFQIRLPSLRSGTRSDSSTSSAPAVSDIARPSTSSKATTPVEPKSMEVEATTETEERASTKADPAEAESEGKPAAAEPEAAKSVVGVAEDPAADPTDQESIHTQIQTEAQSAQAQSIQTLSTQTLSTQIDTPSETQSQTKSTRTLPKETPRETPRETPKETPNDTPQETPQETQETQETRKTPETQEIPQTQTLPSPTPIQTSTRPSTPQQAKTPTAQTPSLPATPLLSDFPSPTPASPKRTVYNVRPRSSIPLDLAPRDYARQCIAAAESSRLNPYGLHPEEHAMLRQHIGHAQVTTYLNIRNGILRLWLRRPDVAITREEAVGCAKDSRWFDVASVCFDWLMRRGYVNFGCVQFRGEKTEGAEKTREKEKTEKTANKRLRIVVIGAGMAGLGCARQLEGLFLQYANHFTERGEELPEVVVLEGRNRIGGRVYSRAFQNQPEMTKTKTTDPSNFPPPPPGFSEQQCRSTGEMGGMIITGFERGNPMNILVRGQLGLGYHLVYSETTIYDTDGKPVDGVRDVLVENLFNECLDRVSTYKFKLPTAKIIEGNHDLINEGRGSLSEGHRTMAQVEDATSPSKSPRGEHFFSSSSGPSPEVTPAAQKVREMGWQLKPGITDRDDLDLDRPAKTDGATLGHVVEDALQQYAGLVDLGAQDFRLLNWHIANLEYSNAINHTQLSLQGWDIDAGNEWEGKHSMVLGGYQRVARGLMQCPRPLTVERERVVKRIRYGGEENATEDTGNMEKPTTTKPITVECEGGHLVEADYVVNTIPLGVLKHGSVEFDPPLPKWKADAIERLGFGVLNKILLTYRTPFWDTSRDIFGVLRVPENKNNKNNNPLSLHQADYSQQRGRMFQWFNVTRTTGVPCLLALMAGDAAYDVERTTDNNVLVAEATAVLRSVFGADRVPDQPVEAIITRWASDPFARGSYSSAGPGMRIDDYDTMAKPVGQGGRLLFAGEHTTGTHPATVHGAYLSGLRAASDIVESVLGPIAVPSPLVLGRHSMTTTTSEKKKRRSALRNGEHDDAEDSSVSMSSSSQRRCRRRLHYGEQDQQQQHDTAAAEEARIRTQLGPRPDPPARVVDTSYLLFSKANYARARRQCEAGKASKPRPLGKAGGGVHRRALPNEVRVVTSKLWRSASAEERRPYAEQAARQKVAYLTALAAYQAEAAQWDAKAAQLRAEWAAAGKGGEKDKKDKEGNVEMTG